MGEDLDGEITHTMVFDATHSQQAEIRPAAGIIMIHPPRARCEGNVRVQEGLYFLSEYAPVDVRLSM